MKKSVFIAVPVKRSTRNIKKLPESARVLVHNDFEVIYGGGSIGLMGTLVTVLEEGQITGIIRLTRTGMGS